MPYASMKNKSGAFIVPSLASTSAAFKVAIPDDTRISVTDTDAADGYPISTFTWILIYKEQNYNNRSQAQVDTTVKLLWWMIHDGQKYAEALQYAALPAPAIAKAEAVLKSVMYNGAPVLK